MCVFHTNISCKNFTFFGFKELNSPPTYSFIVSVGVQPRHQGCGDYACVAVRLLGEPRL